MLKDIKKRVFQGAIVILGGQGAAQAMRLAGNLILTRLLVPELFGLMAIVNVLIMALGLFSDIGTGPGVIRSPRGMEPDFLNTAWTIQVLRGLFLWMLSLLAAYPAALIYDKPILLKLLPVIGFGFVTSGFNSMALVTLEKSLKMARLVALNLVSQAIAITSMITLAYIYRNIWALVIGSIVGGLARTLGSHCLDRNLHHRFMLDRSVAFELFHFGKWIFLSTSMMFLATQSDRLLLGKLFPLGLLGVYSIASGFAELPKNIVNTISSSIIFPVISLYGQLPRPELRQKILQKRKLLLLPLALLVALFSGFGDYLIYFLYDSRYREAGWILPLLALGMWPLLLYATIDRVLYVVDNPRYPALGNCVKFLYMIVCLPLAYMLWGKVGAVLAVAFNDIPMYLVIAYGLRKKKLSGFSQDILFSGLLVFFLSSILLVRYLLGGGLPGFEAFCSAIN